MQGLRLVFCDEGGRGVDFQLDLAVDEDLGMRKAENYFEVFEVFVVTISSDLFS